MDKLSETDHSLDSIIEKVLTLPKERITGILYSYRAYFNKGVADAHSSGIPIHKKGPQNNLFIQVYFEGFNRSLKLLEKVKSNV